MGFATWPVWMTFRNYFQILKQQQQKQIMLESKQVQLVVTYSKMETSFFTGETIVYGNWFSQQIKVGQLNLVTCEILRPRGWIIQHGKMIIRLLVKLYTRFLISMVEQVSAT